MRDAECETPRLVPELLVSDLKASLAFWIDLAGFAVVYDRPEHGFAMIGRSGARIMLEQRDLAERTWEAGPLERPFGRGINFQIDVDDLEEILARLQSAQWSLFMAPEEKWYRRGDCKIGVRQFVVQDPDGYLARFSTRLAGR